MAAIDNTFQTRLDFVTDKIETVLSRILPEPAGPQKSVMEAMRYAALGGGKRLRPFLLIEAARMIAGAPKDVEDGVWMAAAALECIHVYSLIHDDLPCMDDDDIRRGKPTVHKVYDEAMGVLAGDALLTLAFEVMADPKIHKEPETRLSLISELAQASGTHGMIGGQVIDIYAEGNISDGELIRQLQALKTGALIHYAAIAGGRLTGASAKDLENLSTFANALGLAFQIRDDILDTEGDAHIMGKAAQKDAGLGKATFVSIHGLEGAKAFAKKLGDEAKTALAPYGDSAAALIGAVDFVLERKK